ncbi:hypothetical protein PROFUN_16010 [Planoprotostelium fungivorum]|uniref:Uncharacterized protein n=1 Tax=Planoprotostelium fungivorum TaxID=1890364 RepID=A0A2P6MT91_9EUKA|nr:hypothetical protein PROFUN_16010 [Planoprotostelium fungivorum]
MPFAQVGHRFRDTCDIPLESARLRETTPGLPRSGICFYLRMFASEMSANYAKFNESLFIKNDFKPKKTKELSVQMALSQLEMTFTTFLFHRWNQRICPVVKAMPYSLFCPDNYFFLSAVTSFVN